MPQKTPKKQNLGKINTVKIDSYLHKRFTNNMKCEENEKVMVLLYLLLLL